MCYSINIISVFLSLLLFSHEFEKLSGDISVLETWFCAISLVLYISEIVQAEEITGTVGQDVRLNFTGPITVKTVSLYKDGTKIGECSLAETNCICTRLSFTKSSQGVIVSISNLTMADSGNYSVTFFNLPNFHESKLLSLVVHFQDLTTDSSPPYRSNGSDLQEASPESFLFVYIILALGLVSVTMPSVLLSVFYQSPRSSGHHQRSCSSNKFQVPSGVAMSVCPVEYAALDFPASLNADRRPERGGKAAELRETVDYATITFAQG